MKKKEMAKKKKKEVKEKEAKVYTVNLSEARNKPRTRRSRKALKALKDYLTKNLKSTEIKIDSKLNDLVVGGSRPPSRVKVQVNEEDTDSGVVYIASLAE